MELHQLRVLRELTERGSVRAAAQALYITPSAVSQHLKALQRSAGTPLVTHEGRRLVLTDAGRALAAAAVEVERSMALARNAIERDADRCDRVVTIAAFPSAGRVFLPRIAARFAGVDGHVVDGHVLDGHVVDGQGAGVRGSGGLRVALADHDAAPEQTAALCGDHDVVIAHRWRIDTPWPADRVAVTSLLDEPYDVALPAHHALAQRTQLTPQDLHGVTWIAGQEGWAPAGIITAIGAVAGREPEVRHRINDLATAVALVREVGGVTLVPRFVGDYLVRDGVVTRPLSGVESRREVAALSRPDRAVSAAVVGVVAALGEIAEQLRAGHHWRPPAL